MCVCVLSLGGYLLSLSCKRNSSLFFFASLYLIVFLSESMKANGLEHFPDWVFLHWFSHLCQTDEMGIAA